MRTSILLLLLLPSQLLSQNAFKKNPVVEQIVKEVSAANIRRSVETLVGFKTRHALSDTANASTGIGAARRWIRSEFERYAKSSGGRMTVEYQEFIAPVSQRIPHPTNIVNVIATLTPTNREPQTPNHIFIVSGHYDSRASNALDSTSAAPGANDDGSGTALVLELARIFSNHEFRATIKFVAFAGEEEGLIGSTYFADAAKRGGWNIRGVFNNDIVGNTHGGNGEIESSYVRLFSEAYSLVDTGSIFRQRNSLGLENDGASRILARYIKEASELYLPEFAVNLVFRRDRFLRGGDHIPFNDRGYAAVRFTEARENFNRQHQDVRAENGTSYGDVAEQMDFNYCARIAQANAAGLASVALAPSAPANAEILTKNLEYSTELRWNKNTENDVSGYFVRYRLTNAPVWQNLVFTKDTSISLQISKDEYLFGVQAVDDKGDVGLVSIPKPAR